MKSLLLDRDKCTGCRTCEFACSMNHYGVFNPDRSRIRIYRTGCLELKEKHCIQCAKPRCVSACPTGAIKQDETGVLIEAGLCTNCQECMNVCDRIFSDSYGNCAIICDHCGACEEACPEGALHIRKRRVKNN